MSQLQEQIDSIVGGILALEAQDDAAGVFAAGDRALKEHAEHGAVLNDAAWYLCLHGESLSWEVAARLSVRAQTLASDEKERLSFAGTFALVLLRQDEPEDALEQIDEVIEAAGDHPFIQGVDLQLRGAILFALGRVDAGLEAIQAGRQLVPQPTSVGIIVDEMGDRVEPSEEAITGFWRWFGDNLDTYAQFPPSEGDLDALHLQLRRVHPGLVFELGQPKGESTRVLTLSADGILTRFEAVSALVDAAPALDGWRAVAFRQPRPLEKLHLGPTVLDPAGIWCEVQWDSQDARFELIVHFDCYTPELEEALFGATLLLLDHAIGEERVAMEIGGLGIDALNEDPREAGYLPISELAQGLDAARPK